MSLEASLERNVELERELIRVKKELNKSLKWTASSQILARLTSQRSNDGKGLESQKVNPPYNPHSNYVFASNNLPCSHCGRNDHLKINCKASKRTEESCSKCVEQAFNL